MLADDAAELDDLAGEELPERAAMSLINANVAAPVNAAVALNALVAAGNVGGDGERDAVSAYLDDPDEATRDVAAWAIARLEERDA